jgi:hypothetical protein
MNTVWKAHWFWSKYIPDDAVIGVETHTAWNHHQDENNCFGHLWLCTYAL